MADYIRPTPRNPILGLIADALTGGVEYMRSPQRAQQMQGLGGLLAETGIPATMERLSYGEPLTKGRGMTTRLRPEAEAALMTLGPEAVPIGRGAMAGVRATKGLPVGASVRQVAPQEEALRLAQQRAALPVSEGGLGLPANNTPMDRARAMGFYTNVYHGTTQDVPAFDISRAGSSTGHESAKIPAVWTTRRPEVANIFTAENVHDAYPVSVYGPAGGGLRSIRVLKTLEGGNVMPLMLRGTPEETLTAGQAQKLIFGDKGGDWRDAGSNFSERFNEKPVLTKIKGHPQAELEFRADQYVVPDPSMLRSRFAAFDPTRRNEPDLLAGALPFTVLLDEENRAALENQLGGLLGR